MPLVTSNLHLTDILSVLGVETPKEIFYNGETLKTLSQIKQVVNRLGLNAGYCVGETDTDRITNLLADRKLSYFKGYAHTQISSSSNELAFDFLGETFSVDITANCYYSITDDNTWITTNVSNASGNTTIEITCIANPAAERVGTVTLTAETGETIEIYISQEAHP